jgi:prephenate dehydrogenase
MCHVVAEHCQLLAPSDGCQMVSDMSEPTVLVSSLGLMGGSLAAALSRIGWRVLLHHRRPEVARHAEELGFGKAMTDVHHALDQADLVVVCSPVGTIAETVRQLAALHKRPIFTDVGSVKGPICAALRDLGEAGRYVGSHPMAGSHLQGLQHARANLYHGCMTAVTPVAQTPETSIALVEHLWRAVGSRVCRFLPEAHDQAVAQASHLPHVMAAATAALLGASAAPLAASGFRDTTRVAGGSPELWADILLHNREAMLESLHLAQQQLQRLEQALIRQDSNATAAWLEQGRAGRSRFEHHAPLDVPTIAEEA